MKLLTLRNLSLAGALVLLLNAYGFDMRGERRRPPGMIAPDAPLQEELDSVTRWKKDDYLITPLATFSGTARVLMTSRFYFTAEADLSPIDLTLAWGPLSDQSYIDRVSFSRGHRFYFWSAKGADVDPQEVIRHTANMHLVPASKAVRKVLFSARPGDLFEFEGYLIRAERADGFSWVSSTTREDTGDGACELVWVERAAVH